MNKRKTLGAFFTAGLIAFTLSGCVSSSAKESTGQTLDDSVITAKVKTALLNADNIDSSDISVETWKGHVQLSGFVSSREQESLAVGVTHQVKGVTAVDNDMQIK